MSKLTHAEFSSLTALLAADAASWSADALTLPEDYSDPMRDWALDKFLAKMRAWLDHIEVLAKQS